MGRQLRTCLAATLALLLAACSADSAQHYDALPRSEFNRRAVRLDMPLYWVADANHDGRVQPDEVTTLLFFPTAGPWVAEGRFTSQFDSAYASLVGAARAAAAGKVDTDVRRRLVGEDLDAGRSALVYTDLRSLAPADGAFVEQMLKVAALIDTLYARQTGATALAGLVPVNDLASQSLFRRDWGPVCAGPRSGKDPRCSAIPGAPRRLVDVYPESLQADPGFCKALEARSDAAALLGPFTVVREHRGRLQAESYAKAYREPMAAIADALLAATATLDPAREAPLVRYLTAAAQAFRSNDWQAADEAWVAMNALNSRWYVRVAPDETYWEPCSHKAGFHLTFARINAGSLAWQERLLPRLATMEAAVAERAGPPYVARSVRFHVPDFIDIVFNAGDDRWPLVATIGESLPNQGPVSREGRGRTMAVTNLFQDADSLESGRASLSSVLDAASMGRYTDDPQAGLLNTILHELTHNLGPTNEYRLRGRTAEEIFGGNLASMLEELKAECGALYFVDYLRREKLIDEPQAAQVYAYGVSWQLGFIAHGMTDGSGRPEDYGQLAAIMLGDLIDAGALSWDPAALAANGTDRGALTIHQEKMAAAASELLRVVAGIKARGDVAAAKALVARYVDGSIVVPHALIAERYQRIPGSSLVYAVRR